MKITKETLQEIIREEFKSLNERTRQLPRQLKDKKKEMMVVKNGKVQVIDKKDWNKYKRKGYLVAENDSVNESYSGNMSDFKYDFESALNNLGISGKAIKKISKKGKRYEVRLSSYMNKKETWEKLGKEIGANLVDFKPGRINIGLYESVNEAKLKPKKLTQLKRGEKFVFNNTPYEFIELYPSIKSAAKVKTQDGKTSVVSFGGGVVNKNTKGGFSDYLDKGGRIWDNVNIGDESVNEAKKFTVKKLGDDYYPYGLYYNNKLVSGLRSNSKKEVENSIKSISKVMGIKETNVNEANAVSGGKIHKFITGKNLTYKGKKYSDIEFELLGIDNNDKLVKLKILSPKNLFGHEMKVPFRTIRRGPFIKTDTSK